MTVPTLGTLRSKRGHVQDIVRRDGVRVLAAAAAALAAMTLWSGAEAAETHIRGFPFGCETPDGQILKPKFGDIDGVSYADLPAQRQQCLGTIDRKIALCRANVDFASDAGNERFSDCLPTFERQAKACVVHFTLERGKCGTDDPGPDDRAGALDEWPTQEGPPADRYRVKPVDRMARATEAANVRTGPSPDYDIAGTVMRGDEVRVTGEVRGRDWVRVEFRGGSAFIYGPLLRTVKTEGEGTTQAREEETAAVATPSRKPSGPDWSIAENQPCQVWNYGNREYEPFTWSGDCVDGKASGAGRLVFRGGEGVYDGTMQAGRMHGSGVLDWSNGFHYEGELRDGKQHGRGTFTDSSGERYDGNWRDGRPHGQGTYVQSDGTTYEGAWRDGCFGERDGRWASIGREAAACGFE